MNGINSVTYSGNVGSVKFTETHEKGDPVATFMVCCEKKENFTTWAKVSAYGRIAKYCMDNLKKGDYVQIDGELTNKKNRISDHMELEIKATRQIVIHKKGEDRGDDRGKYHQEESAYS